MDHEINANYSEVVIVHGETTPWSSSPNPSVERRRLELYGSVEAGRVTSIVRYLPNSSFHSHGHPEGEEILVLEGTFCDEHGSYPAGSYLLNPEGFSHQPFSEQGCYLLVKLRQFPGLDKQHVFVNTAEDSQWTELQKQQSNRKLLLYDCVEELERIALYQFNASQELAVCEFCSPDNSVGM